MTTSHLYGDIEHEEGRRKTAYTDTKGIWTIGVGHTGSDVHEGASWTDAHIDTVLHNDVAHVLTELNASIPWWKALDDVRQDVLVQMGFQMGVTGLLKFERTLDAVERGDYRLAAERMLQSKWGAVDTPERAKRMAWQMKSGQRAWAIKD